MERIPEQTNSYLSGVVSSGGCFRVHPRISFGSPESVRRKSYKNFIMIAYGY